MNKLWEIKYIITIMYSDYTVSHTLYKFTYYPTIKYLNIYIGLNYC